MSGMGGRRFAVRNDWLKSECSVIKIVINTLLGRHRDMNKAAKCEICGTDAEMDGRLCSECQQRYMTGTCAACGVAMLWSRNVASREICSQCASDQLAESLPSEVWTQLDPIIFEGEIIDGSFCLMNGWGLSHDQAQGVFFSRYRHLRKVSPERFAVDDETYWSGYYS